MVSEDRQRIIETNRSLRLIKNELESLLEKGIITDAAFDSISDLLPAETPLSGAAAARTTNNNLPIPARSTASPAPSSHSQAHQTPSQPNNISNPPSYAHSQSTAAPPSLPSRTTPNQPPSRPVLARARALYRYAAGDARDVSFERDDELSVLEYMNADWWMGRNERTGAEGIFPRSYVVVLPAQDAPQGEKVGGYPAQPVYAGQLPQQQGGYPVSPVPVGGYPAPPPPGQAAVPYQQGGGQVDQGQGGESKFGEQGKKFGKKLGNAAIFGAGATIGSNIVNSIF